MVECFNITAQWRSKFRWRVEQAAGGGGTSALVLPFGGIQVSKMPGISMSSSLLLSLLALVGRARRKENLVPEKSV